MNIDKKEEQHRKLYEIVRGVDNLRMILFELGASPAFIIDNLLRCDAEALKELNGKLRKLTY